MAVEYIPPTNSSASPPLSLPMEDLDAVSKSGLIPGDFLDTFVFVNYVILSTVICFLGIIFNVINIIIFYRLGFQDTVNISLFSLSCSDLGVLLPLLWRSILFNPDFWEKMPFEHLTFQYYSGGWPQGCIANISSLTMVYVTLDRCLCVTMPLKVKSIITPRRTVIVIISIYVIMISSLVPLYAKLDFGPIFFPNRNKTLLGLRYSQTAQYVEDITFAFYVSLQVFTSSSVTIFSIILVVYLRKQSAWRQQAANTNNSNMSMRDTKIVKMVLFVALLFLSLYIPSTASVLVMLFHDEFNFTGRFINLVTVIWALLALMSAANSTLNFFVYLNMSSKYANVFKGIFGRFNIFYKSENETKKVGIDIEHSETS